MIVGLAACVNTQHAEVKLANNPVGADCYSRCIQATVGEPAVDCVAACPGAIRDSGDCEGALACVEDRTAAKGKTTWLIIGAVAATLVLMTVAGGGGAQ